MNRYQKILAVIDPEALEQKSLSRALEIATKSGASVTAFLSIYELSYEMTTMLSMDERETMRQAVVDDRSDWLTEMVEQIVDDVKVSVDVKVVWHNRPFESIIYEVIDNSYDLIVKGTHDHSVLKSVIFTPTDWHLMRKSPVPVLLVKEHGWPADGQIVAAINVGVEDDAHISLNDVITQQAQGFATLLGAQVNLVNAFPGTPVNIAIEIPEFDPIGYTESVKRHHCESMLQHADKYHINESHCHVREGLPEDVIPQVASELDAELVIIGTVGRQGISAALLGNTAEHVIDKLDCDVLAIKPQGFVCPIKR